MAVISLACVNVLRRLSRSILALMTMAIAAAVLTSGMSLSQGTPGGAYQEYRDYFRGEILVFAPGFLGAGPAVKSDAPLVHRDLIDSGFNPLLKYNPIMKTEGYYAQEDQEYRPISESDIEDMRTIPGIIEASPHFVMPAESTGRKIELKPFPPHLPFPNPDLKIGLDYDFEIVINGFDTPKAHIGDILEIELPLFQLDTQGIPYVDRMSDSVIYKALVTDIILYPTRLITWVDGLGNTYTEQGYVHSPDIYLREKDWNDLWREHAKNAKYPHLMVSLKVSSMSTLNDIVIAASESFSDLAIYPISSFVDHLNRHTLLDDFYRAPPNLWRGEPQTSINFAQQDFRQVTSFFLFVTAGMMLASQMLASVAGRRKEIGILKAIGAKQQEVIAMILFEVVVLALLGATAGFATIRAAALYQAITNRIPFLMILRTTALEYGIVLAATLIAAIVFGVLPAWKVSKLTVMEVFRND